MIFLVSPNALAAVSPNLKNVTPARSAPPDLLECGTFKRSRERIRAKNDAASQSAAFGGLSETSPASCRTSTWSWAMAKSWAWWARADPAESTIALALLRLLDHKGGVIRGEVRFGGRDLLRLPEREMRKVRGREIALVLHEPAGFAQPIVENRHAIFGSVAGS